MPVSIETTAAQIDLTQRIGGTTAVVASPALAAETIIASLTVNTDEAIFSGAIVHGWAAFVIGASGTAYTLRIRKTNVSGTVVSSTGTILAAAGVFIAATIDGVDATPAATGQVYVLTLQVTAGGAASTVTATELHAIVV